MSHQSISIIHNLEDAGCDDELTEQFFCLRETGRVEGQLRLLSKQRTILLDNIHSNQKRLDCLDYLINKIKKEQVE
jgi:hypothetical protein